MLIWCVFRRSFQIFSCNRRLDNWVRGFAFTAYGDCGTSASGGVAILLRKSLNIQVLQQSSFEKGRSLLVKLKLNDSCFNVANIHAPSHNPEKSNFFNTLYSWLDPVEYTILAGDFNCY